EAAAEAAPPATPDLSARQGYLDAAPGGIDARFAWTRPGGLGAGVRIIDVEGAWRFSHEDLLDGQGGVADGTPSSDLGWRNHGTAVIGEFSADRNGIGVVGICPEANVRAVSIFGPGSAGAIQRAADLLGPGDILLIELHRPGPRFNYQNRTDQRGYVAVEWWPDDFAAIRYATGRGVIVVEAAGNGAEDLDDALYDARPAGFPATWTNPYRRGAADSGAVLVGAGAPPPGTHGHNHGPDRSRLDFSNHGALIDAQGWGREVTTTGYGDLQGGADEDLWYTDRFSGTSSASPIVVGALGCVQGARRAAGVTLLTPATARALLRSTGSPQTDAPGRPATQRIGNRPDLKAMLPVVAVTPKLAPLYRYWNPRIGDHFYTTNFAELGTGRYGYPYEGVQCQVNATRGGSVPLHRYWNPKIGDHFYTTNFAELGTGRYGYRYEGVQCHVELRRLPGSLPLYRYWNPRIGDHFYTTSFAELGRGRHGYTLEGIQCFVFPRSHTPAPPDTTDGDVTDGDATIGDGIAFGDLGADESFLVDLGGAVDDAPAGPGAESFTVDGPGAVADGDSFRLISGPTDGLSDEEAIDDIDTKASFQVIEATEAAGVQIQIIIKGASR
ncbi:MAG: S8 family serine peptidase, partial [Myxococcales bacterium]|nr:S8 family serine peptidase [Myxococcales bacterium]